MKLDFLQLPANERRLYIEQAAIERNVSADRPRLSTEGGMAGCP